MPRGQLAALLWPENQPEVARNTLRQRLFQRLCETGLTTLCRGDGWLAAAQALKVTVPDERAQVPRTVVQWIQDIAQCRVPQEFRDSFHAPQFGESGTAGVGQVVNCLRRVIYKK
jgi:hypothetical protein